VTDIGNNVVPRNVVIRDSLICTSTLDISNCVSADLIDNFVVTKCLGKRVHKLRTHRPMVSDGTDFTIQQVLARRIEQGMGMLLKAVCIRKAKTGRTTHPRELLQLQIHTEERLNLIICDVKGVTCRDDLISEQSDSQQRHLILE